LWCKVSGMFTRSEAEENLRTIRSLMERSTIYRAISAPTALVGGVLSVVACATYHYVSTDVVSVFLGFWLGTLVLTAAANTWFIWKGAKARSEPFISSGMKLAIISLLPSMLCAGFFTFYVLITDSMSAYILPTFWMICYGLGLLSTSHFAPRSITLLGWVFLFSGFAVFLFQATHSASFEATIDTFSKVYSNSNLLMGATFGVYHLIYAACTWPRKTTGTTPGVEP